MGRGKTCIILPHARTLLEDDHDGDFFYCHVHSVKKSREFALAVMCGGSGGDKTAILARAHSATKQTGFFEVAAV